MIDSLVDVKNVQTGHTWSVANAPDAVNLQAHLIRNNLLGQLRYAAAFGEGGFIGLMHSGRIRRLYCCAVELSFGLSNSSRVDVFVIVVNGVCTLDACQWGGIDCLPDCDSGFEPNGPHCVGC